jgi:hypothetical protein
MSCQLMVCLQLSHRKTKSIEFYSLFIGDLRDDLILMNELENIRHVQLNKINNNSLGEKQSLRFSLKCIL